MYRICRAFEEHEKQALNKILAEFFILTDNGYTQKRVEIELAKRRELSGKRSTAVNNRYKKPTIEPTIEPTIVTDLYTQSQSQSQDSSKDESLEGSLFEKIRTLCQKESSQKWAIAFSLGIKWLDMAGGEEWKVLQIIEEHLDKGGVNPEHPSYLTSVIRTELAKQTKGENDGNKNNRGQSPFDGRWTD